MIFWIVVSVLLAFLLGLIFKGNFKKLANFRLRFWGLVFVALLIQIVIFWDFLKLSLEWLAILYFLSLLLLLLFTLLNVKVPGMVIIILGVFLNLLVIAFNGGFMPADPQSYLEAGRIESVKTLQDVGYLNNVKAAGNDTRLNFLGDWIVLPQPFFPNAVVSLGDLILLLGLFYLILRILL